MLPPEASKPKRRYHTAEYKIAILKEADACKGHPGAIGALLRREGLYSSLLADWRRQRDEGGLSALSRLRGPKVKHNYTEEKLRRENELLKEELRQANLIIQVQKKISEILGIPQPDGELP
jgi:transposase